MNNLDHDQNDEETLRCRQCDATIQLGEDIRQLVEGVLGPRGFVPLESPLNFCSEACLRGYVSGTDEHITKLPRRIP